MLVPEFISKRHLHSYLNSFESQSKCGHVCGIDVLCKNMRKIIFDFIARMFFPVVLFLYANLVKQHPIPLQWTGFLFLTIALWPIVVDVMKNVVLRKFDVGFSMLLTIYLLVYLNSISIAAIFVLIIIIGNLFKEIILYKVRDSLKKITVYLPHTGFIKTLSGDLEEVEISLIKIGNVVAVHPGERVPADGILLAQEALLDESVISGESRPIQVEGGGEVPAGAINAGDYFEMRATRVGENSTVAQIRKIAEEAGREKTPIARFIDQYAKYTSLITAILVVVVYITTGNLFRALGLWIAMVPIVFAIIGPISISIGISTAARLGILVKHAETIEDLTKVKHIIFDKTGTLTVGSPAVRGVIIATNASYTENGMLALVGGLEKKSEHEIARAIIREVTRRNITFEEFSDVHVMQGGGLAAEREGKHFFVGNKKFLENQGVAFPLTFMKAAAEKEDRGETPIFVALDNTLIGGIFVADTLRPETPKAVQILHREGYNLHILTGDDRAVASYVAGLLNLEESSVSANLSPQDKITYIHALEKKRVRTIMVGDGINDAPALSAATVGIAMGVRGTDLATNAADIVLVNENFLKIPEIIAHSKRVISVIKQDLVAATVIHIGAGVLSMLGIITLLQTAVFHEASSVLVLANTARLFIVRNEHV